MNPRAHRRRIFVVAAKIAVAVAIIAWLVFQLREQDLFTRLIEQPKNWGALAAAQALVVAAFTTNILRWFLLVRSLGLEFRLGDAFRLGSLGFLLNQVAPGSVGGDLFKAAFIAHEQPGRRTAAIATVVVDRIVGLYAMLLVASSGKTLAGGAATNNVALATLSWVVAVLAVVGTAVLVAFLVVNFNYHALRIQLAKIPIAGATISRFVEAAAAYRQCGSRLLAAVLLACGAHCLLVLAFWMLSRGIPIAPVPLSEMMLVGPMGLVAGAIPLTPSGYGTFEAAMNELFKAIGSPDGDGLLVALCYRVTTYVAASIGGVYYLSARKSVQNVLHEAEELADQLADEHERPTLDGDAPSRPKTSP